MNTNDRSNKRADGAQNEALALAYLTGLGYRLVKQNFRFGVAGEIDLVMRDGPVYVFVEVKSRHSHLYGSPEDAVTPAKRRRIQRVARGFVHVMRITDYQARFDVLAIDYTAGPQPEIRHWIDAF